MSYSTLPAHLVFQACESYIVARKNRITRECAELIEPCIGYRAWFGFGKPATREQVEAELADEIGLIKITGGMWHNKICQLRDLAVIAKKCNTSVVVDAELASLLEPHFG